MPYIFKDAAKNDTSLAVVEEGSQLGFGRGRNNKMNHICTDMEYPVQTDQVYIFLHPSHEEMPAGLTPGIGLR
jgi:hypothetical protein